MSEPTPRPDDPTMPPRAPGSEADATPEPTPDGAGELPEGGADARLAEAEARAAEYMDMALRARADMDNLRKRHQIELAAAHKYAVESFAESLLPVRDGLEMALKVEVPSVESLREGVDATLRLLASAFDRHKLQVIDPVGEKFDPNRHQAISMVPGGDVPANHVVTVLQKGYLINDRVLRPALVTVRSGS
ncbi:MAG TPA: nucleotide exchange factor GrpE [Burkholderiaceae bacterium]|nr:nucleotide exchange factor GrpE [Burkholderiaceae bacterium]